MDELAQGHSLALSSRLTNDDLDNDEVFVDAPDNSASEKCPAELVSSSDDYNKGVDRTVTTSNEEETRGSASSLCPTISTERVTSSTSSLQLPRVSPNPEDEQFRFDRVTTSVVDALKSEEAFIDYVMSLPSCQDPSEVRWQGSSRSKATSAGPPSRSGTKVGLDHLDNLCKLMEQLSELREANSKLQRRVQYLENVKSLHEMHKEIRADLPYGSDGVLVQKTEMKGTRKNVQLVDFGLGTNTSRSGSPAYFPDEDGDTRTTMTKENVFMVRKVRTQVNISQSQTRTRERSKSVGHEEICDTKSKRIFPKWSRVKEALGWERSGPSEERQGNSSGVFGEGKHQGASDREVMRGTDRILYGDHVGTLRIPLYTEYMDKDDLSPSSSLGGEPWGGAASSIEDINEDIFRQRSGRWKRQSLGPSEKRSSLEPPHEQLRRQKSTPSPTDRIQHDVHDAKPRALTLERDMDPEQAFVKFDKEEAKKSHRSPWGRVKTIIERRRDSLRRKHRRNESGNTSPRRGDKIEADLPSGAGGEVPAANDDIEDVLKLNHINQSVNDQRKCFSLVDSSLEDSKIIPATGPPLTPTQGAEEEDRLGKKKYPSVMVVEGEDEIQEKDLRSTKGRKLKPPALPISSSEEFQTPTERDLILRTPSSSPQFHRKSRWTKVKKVLRGKKEEERSQSVPSSPLTSNGRTTFDFEDIGGLLEDDACDDKGGAGSKFLQEDDLMLEDGRINSYLYQTSQADTRSTEDNFHAKLTPSASAPVASLMLELQRNLSEDFSRKIQEWEKIRSVGLKPLSPKFERKESETAKVRKGKHEKSVKSKIKDLNWLEKELQKIEKESRRLTKEKQKYEDRAHRLQRLRETVLSAKDSNKKEVLIRTSAGEFRFEGISDAFTKKLYEWETKRGVRPELSTIALLDSSFRCKTHGQHPGVGGPSGGDKTLSLQRGLSRSENSVVEVGQPSHTSSNSLPSLKPDITAEHDRALHSRANSEPDLSLYGNLPEVTIQHRSRSGDTLSSHPIERLQSYAPPEVTQLIDSDSEEGFVNKGNSECRGGARLQQAEDNYYNLLEENVLLLEQLKSKEDVCRRLERELDALDERVDEMNKRHLMEMEKYREKLWEVHKPGNKPRDVYNCMKMIGQLKARIEDVEKCSERLRNDREKLEVSFQYHADQQAKMTSELLQKMRELREVTSLDISDDGQERKQVKVPDFDPEDVVRLQDISTRLLKQTKEMEQALAEKSRQVYELRWQLLNRDLSAVRLETELQKAHWQSLARAGHSRCAAKRASYAHKRSWSSGEGMTYWDKETGSYDKEPESFSRLPADVCANLAKTDYEPSQLTSTVHELNKELVKLSSAAEVLLRLQKEEKRTEVKSAVSEIADGRPKQEEERKMALLSPPEADSQWSDIPKAGERGGTNSQIKVRRNSADNISSVSGPDGSESSSLNEGERAVFVMKLSQRPLQKTKSKLSISSSEESSLEEESFSSVSGCRSLLPLGSSSKKTEKEVLTKELVLKYPSIKRKENEVIRPGGQEKHGPDSRIPMSNPSRSYRYEIPQDQESSPLKEKRKLFAAERSKGLDNKITAVSEDCRQDLEGGESIIKDHPHRRRKRTGNNEDTYGASRNVTTQKEEHLNKTEKQDTHLEDNIRQSKYHCKGIGKNQLPTNDTEISIDSNAAGSTKCSMSRNQKDSVSEEVALSYTIQLPRKKSQGSGIIKDECQRIKSPSRQGVKSTENKDTLEPNTNTSVTVVLPKTRAIPKQVITQKSPTEGDIFSKKTHQSVSSPLFKVKRGGKSTDLQSGVPRVTGDLPTITKSSNENVSPKIKRDKIVDESMTLKPESPVIRSRSPRKLKRENSRDKIIVKEEVGNGCIKSPSAPQLDWKKACAKKVSAEGAPNVKNLIEKYNQKVMEHQGLSEPRSPSSAIPIRKGLFPDDPLQQQQLPDSPGERRLKLGYSEERIPTSPQMSQSRTRAELQKAKEQFISSKSVATYKPLLLDIQCPHQNPPAPTTTVFDKQEAKTSPAPEIPRRSHKEEDTASNSSNRSMDSMSLVMFRTGESCQESRLARKADTDSNRQSVKPLVSDSSTDHIKSDKFVSTPTLSKSASTGSNSKLSSRFLNLRLRRSRRKTDMTTVGQLCRQSLYIGLDSEGASRIEKTISPVSPRSCPSSPELKSKGKPKGSWLTKNIFRQK